MKLHRESVPTLYFVSFIFILFNLAMWRLLDDYKTTFNLLSFISLLLLFVCFFFFRVQSKVPVVDTNKLVSPAYGKIVEIVNEKENKFFKSERKRISIFMSPLDIHCNYVPVDGEVVFADYFPGKYLVASNPKSSEKNEHTFFVIKNEHLTYGVKQIAGFVARRIVPYLKTGDQVNQNDEIGFIKFGSRVDLFLPVETKLLVKKGDRLKGGISVIAEL